MEFSGRRWDTGLVKTPTVTRAEARSAQIETIKVVSRRLIAEKGVSGLSLREVAREMGLVSSALYRYFATRDELLTALILDAYNDLGAAVERCDRRFSERQPRERWRQTALAIRRWAKRHPHEYALIYGTPVPNYVAPPATIEAATRVTSVLSRILADDWIRPRSSHRRVEPPHGPRPSTFLEVESLSLYLGGVPPSMYVKALMAWTQIFGFISFDLFGHYVGSVRNLNLMFDEVIDELADSLGLGR